MPKGAHTQPRPPKGGDTGSPSIGEDLFSGADTLLVQHEGETYTLRRTRNGKLIVTK